MANPMRGEASFEANGKRYTLVMSFNELVTLEEEMDVKVEDLGKVLAEKASIFRTVFRICLEERHGVMTNREAGDIISLIGPDAAATALGAAIGGAFPKPGAAANPPKPASAPDRKRRTRGTGTNA